MASYNGRSIEYLRRLGYQAEVVETYSPFSRRTTDLFNFLDVLAVGHGQTVGVQVTSRGNMASRRRKMLTENTAALTELIAAGWALEVHGWDQPGGKGSRWRIHRQLYVADNWDTIEDGTP